ncbi:MAG: metallophosphoesterase [Marinilabiliaceae bacterium]|nr:metallophosphoesterase [Marinilabiliaceae bacterium]
MLRLIHLSDIHYSKDSIEDIVTFVLPSLLKDIEKSHVDNKINLVFLTGDLIDKGGISFSGGIETAFEEFQEIFIKGIIEKTGLSRDEIFFCPGNHDIDLNRDEGIVDENLTSKLKNTEEVNKFIDSNKKDGIRRIIPFKDFERKFRSGFKGSFDISNFQSTYNKKIENKNIGVACLNSAWRCFDSQNDKGRIILGERQVTRPKKIIGNSDLKIALIHHHHDWLAEFDKENVLPLIEKEFDILLCGHVHQAQSNLNTTNYGSIFISVAPSNWSSNLRSKNRSYGIGYQIISIDSKKIEVEYRKYVHEKQQFVPNTDIGNDSGKLYFDLPRKEASYKGNEKNSPYVDAFLLFEKGPQFYKELRTHLIAVFKKLGKVYDYMEEISPEEQSNFGVLYNAGLHAFYNSKAKWLFTVYPKEHRYALSEDEEDDLIAKLEKENRYMICYESGEELCKKSDRVYSLVTDHTKGASNLCEFMEKVWEDEKKIRILTLPGPSNHPEVKKRNSIIGKFLGQKLFSGKNNLMILSNKFESWERVDATCIADEYLEFLKIEDDNIHNTFICVNDEVALGIIDSIQKGCYRKPNQLNLSIFGFDGISEMCNYFNESLRGGTMKISWDGFRRHTEVILASEVKSSNKKPINVKAEPIEYIINAKSIPNFDR